jgi:signal peptidase I
MEFKKEWKKFVKFMKEDSWQSLLVSLVLAFLIIKFIVFPVLIAITGTPLPLVIVESCSMYHQDRGFENTFTSSIYSDYGISIEDSEDWIFQNGFAKGDIIFVLAPKNLEVGDVIIFNGGQRNPIIHRLISVGETYTTKGDNYLTNKGVGSFEKSIAEEQLLGKAVFKIPYLGWIKLIFFDWRNPVSARGLCD